ncbi:hypothetical protein SAMN05444004_10792 [Jannaschia faecimaris]|uniref:Uncharacterized protein n=1 Tax=Jannaschia faecimaris TaxID=1244108 RepID=A0A1H3R0S7_9RHOB|nr:hypothetical protein SAMN05444004_10792 [Jannaschia faecimaris]
MATLRRETPPDDGSCSGGDLSNLCDTRLRRGALSTTSE